MTESKMRDQRETGHVVLVDPSTGLGSYATELGDNQLGLILVETERSLEYPSYYGSPDKSRIALRVRCEESEVVTTIAKLATEYDIAAVCAGDESALAVAEAAAFTVRRPVANDPATSALRCAKFAMNETLASHGFYTPKQLLFSLETSTLEAIEARLRDHRFPVMFKPNEAAGSVCTYKCPTAADVPRILRAIRDEHRGHDMSPVSTEFLAQEFVTGPEYLVDSYSHDKTHYVTGVFNYTKFLNEDVPIYQSVNYDGIGEEEEAAVAFVRTALDVLGNRTGMVNTDFIRSSDRFALLEVNCRIVGFGGWLSKLEKHLFGSNQATLLARDVQGRLHEAPLTPCSRRVGKMVLLQSKEARTMRVPNDRALRQLRSYVDNGWHLSEGSPLRPATSFLKHTVGVVLLASESKEALERDYAELIAMQDGGELF